MPSVELVCRTWLRRHAAHHVSSGWPVVRQSVWSGCQYRHDSLGRSVCFTVRRKARERPTHAPGGSRLK